MVLLQAAPNEIAAVMNSSRELASRLEMAPLLAEIDTLERRVSVHA